MPLRPDEVHNHAVTNRLTKLQEACAKIDKQLIDSYDGERPMDIQVDARLPNCDMEDLILIKMIKDAYQKIGWEVDGEDLYDLVFRERVDSQYSSGLPYR